jgi:PERQ amino acid-rich with GYF domain-containing protein
MLTPPFIGPFRADLMQKWYEEGYFTPDLPMKRIHLDSQWFTVQELVTQATGASVFLTPPPPAGPPGLHRQSSHRSPEHIHKEPFQPAPIRSLRTSNLESSLTGASLASDSPSSSFGASQLGNSSPEPSTLIGRDKRSYGGIEADGRIPGFGLQEISTPGFIGTRLNSNGFVHDLGATFEGQSTGGFVPDRDVGLNGHVFNNHPPMVQDSWSSFPNSSFGITNANLTTLHGPPTNLFNDGVTRGYGFDLSGSGHLPNFGGLPI